MFAVKYATVLKMHALFCKTFTPFESLPCPMQQYLQNAKIFWGSCWTATRGDALLLEKQCSILGCWDRAKILGIAQQQ